MGVAHFSLRRENHLDFLVSCPSLASEICVSFRFPLYLAKPGRNPNCRQVWGPAWTPKRRFFVGTLARFQGLVAIELVVCRLFNGLSM